MTALLAAAENAPSGSIGGLILPVIMIAVFYLLLIRPQQRKAKKQQALISSVSVGDRVITIGGLHATVESLDDETMRLEIAPGVTITMARAAIARRLGDPDEVTDETPAAGAEADGVAGV